MPNATGQFDTSIEIVTPENIAFRHRVAGPFRRLPAYLIDSAIQVVAGAVGLAILMTLFGMASLPFTGLGLWLVAWFLLNWFYYGLFETYWNGQTPGKRMMHIRVVSVDGQPIGGLQAVLRNVMRVLDGQPGLSTMVGPFTYMVGLLAAAMNDRFQRLGDLVCGTMVVIEERQWYQGLARTGELEVERVAAQIPAAFQPSRTMARALATYVQRRRYFAWARRLEIARHLSEPLRQDLNLPADVSPDLLLCALYHRTFIGGGQEGAVRAGSPFGDSPVIAAAVVEEEGIKEAIIVDRGGGAL